MNLKEAFAKAAIIADNKSTPRWSHTYMGYGWKMRKKYVNMILETLENSWYEEWNFSDLISHEDFNTMNASIMDISKKSMFIDDKQRAWDILQRQIIAPTHEVPIYTALKDHIKYESDLPLKFVHTGSAYRRPKSNPFPFCLWERRSFIEGHGIYKNSQEAESQIPLLRDIIVKLISEQLDMPYIENQRPLSTNNPVSKLTLCHDIILPRFNKTQIAWMIYFHDDIFSKPFWVKYKKPEENYKYSHTPKGIHFGFSDNLLLWTIVNSYSKDKERFLLPEALLPYHADILVEDWAPIDIIKKLEEEAKSKSIKYRITHLIWKSDKKRKYKKSSLQWLPMMIGVSAQWKISIDLWDLDERYNDIQHKDMQDFHENTKATRKNIRESKTIETYKNVIIKWDELNIKDINNFVSKWKIIQIALQQDDDVVKSIESQMTWGEVLWFQPSNSPKSCFHTWEQVSTIASLSRRF